MLDQVKNNCIATFCVLVFILSMIRKNLFTLERVINLDSSQTIGWSTPCCGNYCCSATYCGNRTCCNNPTCCGNQTCCSNSCCGIECCNSLSCGSLPNYYRQTNRTDDTLIASWEEDSPSNWTILSGYIRFTLRGDCSGGTVSVELNGQQIAQVSVSQQQNQNATIPLNVSVISSVIRGGTNNVSLIPFQNRNCTIVGGVDFGPYPNFTTVIQIELIYCGESTDLQSPKECDGGSGCNKTTCQCERELGYIPLNPIQSFCFGCGNGIYDPPLEECDNGVGCLSNCLCNSQMGYRPTTPFSIDCDGCGNSIWDADEECDNGVGCLSNCSCNKIQQYVSTIPPSINCTKCGNGILDVGEQCDSGMGCDNVTCRCLIGWKPQELVSCAKCGNAIREPIEECDSGNGCLSNCTCDLKSGYRPTKPPAIGCTKCGNGRIDDGEECDGGIGCDNDCHCVSPTYRVQSPPSIDCELVVSSSSSSNTSTDSNVENSNSVVVGSAVGGVIGGLVFVGGIAVLIFFILRRKKGNQTQVIPIQEEQNTAPYSHTISTLQTNIKPKPSTSTLHNQTIQRNPMTHIITTFYPETKSQQTQSPNNQIQSQTLTKTTMKSDSIPMTVISASSMSTTNTSTTKKQKIPFNELKIQREIGSGSYGKVYLGKWKGISVALKFCELEGSVDEFISEINVQIELPPHPNVVQMYGVSIDGPQMVIVLEYCEGGSLDKLLFDDDKPLSEERMLKLIRRIAAGMYHLHKHNVIHRDLASRNILLTKNGEPKISDFGLSRFLQPETSERHTLSGVGPVCWMSPESLKYNIYSKKSDVWMFGILVYEIVARCEPHSNMSPYEVLPLIRDKGLTPEIPSNCPELLKQLMEKCWQIDPNKRPSFEEIFMMLRDFQPKTSLWTLHSPPQPRNN